MRKLVLALLLAFIVEHAPWRLMALFAETFVTRPGLTRVVQTNNRYWDALALQERIEELSYTVEFTKDLTYQGVPVYGLTMSSRHSVQVEAALSWDARYAVLAHEGGHMALGQSPMYTSEEHEAFAECVALLISHDGIREHARYLSTHKLALFTVIALDSARIYRAAAILQE